ncbi:MAG TPA: hypothetical protein VG758_20935 [Hyphomicrobiaceae bacterium]|nr:hypothetical protein [Hyphomicrobiaceae bacterium]
MSAPDYRLISCLDGGCARAGVLIGDRVIAAAALLGERPGISEWHLPPGTAALLALLRRWDDVHLLLHSAAARPWGAARRWPKSTCSRRSSFPARCSAPVPTRGIETYRRALPPIGERDIAALIEVFEPRSAAN